MIAFFRHLLLDDFWLKLFSTALAVLIWLTVTFANQKEGAFKERVFTGVPVKLVSASADVRNFQAIPDRVELIVRGDARIIDNLEENELRARVDLTGMEASRFLRKSVEVATPPGVTCLHASPQEVEISRGLKVLMMPNETKKE